MSLMARATDIEAGEDGVFRRRRRDQAAEPGLAEDGTQAWPHGDEPAEHDLAADGYGEDEPGEDEDEDGETAGAPGSGLAAPARGPWDAEDDFPQQERIDFGSLLLPVAEGFEIQLNIAEDQGPLIAVVRGESSLQLQAFAAPKSGGLWEDVRQELITAISEAAGSSEQADGPFGPELHARVPGVDPATGQAAIRPVRFMGVDGPRWFLRGVITGPAATHPATAAALEEVFAGVVVVRGNHPAPPRDLLEIHLPEQARQAMEEQMAADGRFGDLPSPFERGPEITETR